MSRPRETTAPARETAALAVRELAGADDAIRPFERLREDGFAWLLDSALPSRRLGRFSFAGADPYWVLRARGEAVELECRRPVRPGFARGRHRLDGDVLEIVRRLMPPAPGERVSVALPFLGGAVGYLGYELAARFESLRFLGADDLTLPDLYLLFTDRMIAHDAGDGRLYACALGFASDGSVARDRADEALDELCRTLGRDAAEARVARRAAGRPPFAFFDASAYAKAVDTVKEEVEAGAVYQACLTHRSERDCAADPWQLYRTLRRLNPAPFASFLELPEVAIVGSSPERFVRVGSDGGVESRPIKGTRRRGADEAEDLALRAALAGSAKDRAENLMIVDLVRNDLGRVCRTGSVHVPELMTLESYASVHQLVSTVQGALRDDCDAFDLVRAAFPPGSMTGAPKIAAMKLLERLEPVRRGVYAGALGYFDVRGGADLCVVIRTILVQAGRAFVHAGGGIVADSDPGAEWREAQDKARLLEAALDEAERCA